MNGEADEQPAGGGANEDVRSELTRPGKVVIGVGLLLALVGTVLVALFSPDPVVTPETAAAVLAIVTAGAVAIERVIEGAWTLVGLVAKNTWWPMNRANEQVNGLVNNLDQELVGVYTNAAEIVRGIVAAKKLGNDLLNSALADLETIRDTTFIDLQTLAQNAPANQRVQFVAAATSRSLEFLESKYPDLQKAMLVANRSIDITAAFVETFKDNPGRRLISICAGAVLGLIFAWTLGLDTFRAAEPAGGGTATLQWGVALTGLLMGLGSTPAHEVIKLVQEVKKSRKVQNNALSAEG